MASRIVDLIYAIALTLPLLISVFYLLKIVRDSLRKDTKGKFVAKLLASFLFAVIASFLICFMAIKFIFVDVVIPNWLNILGIFLFLLYYGTFGGFLYGLGELGSVGVSPNKIVRQLYNDFFKKK